VIAKWKREGTTTTKPRLGRPHVMTDRDRRALKKVVRETRQTSSETIPREFRSATNCPASTMAVRRELSGGGITVWGRFSWTVLGPLVILHGTLNAEGYKDILTRCILFTVGDQFGYDDCLYQHDNAPCHKSRSVRE
jgi:hypothetical protein